MSKLILTNEVAGLGSAGDVVEVKERRELALAFAHETVQRVL